MDKKIKVLFVTSDNTLNTGAFLSTAKLAQLLRDKYNIEPFFVLPAKGDGQTLLNDSDIPFTVVPSFTWSRSKKINFKEILLFFRAIIFNPIAVFRIKKIINNFHPDIVHSGTSWTYVGSLAAYKKNIPVVWHIREFLEEDQNRTFWNKQYAYMLMNKASKVIVISKTLFQKYEQFINRDRLSLIYNGIDVDRFYNRDKDIFGDHNKVSFICVGALVKRKGQRDLIDALYKLKVKGYDNFVLHIVGKGPEEENLQKQIHELNLEDYIILDGFQTDTPKFYRDADIMFMVSNNEAFGRVTVEAMLSGVLVIGANSGGTPEILGDRFGYLYENGNVDDLVEKMEYILNHKNEARQTMIAGRQMAVERYTADKNAEQVYKIYREILD